MRLQDFKQCLSSLKPTGTFLLWGGETFLIDAIVSRLKGLIFGRKESGQTNSVIMHAADCRASDVTAAASTHPFFAEKSLVVVHSISDFPKSDREVIRQYLAEQTLAAVLVLTDTTSHPYRMAMHPVIPKGKARLIDVSSPPPWEFERWVSYLLSRDGKTISPGAMESLRDNVGNNLTTLAMELEKLVCLVGDQKLIDESHTDALLGRSRSDKKYAVADAVISGERTRALTVLSDLLREGSSVSEITGAVRSRLEETWLAKEMLDEGYSSQDVCKELRVPAWRAESFVRTVGRSRPEDLRRSHRLIMNAELRARSAKLDDRTIAELLLIDLCRPRISRHHGRAR